MRRELQPANILVARGAQRAEPTIKIVDFGVSALDPTNDLTTANAATVDGAQATANGLLTQTGVIMGTPLYMAPELVRGAKLARSDADIFSFGVIAYELLTSLLPSEMPPIMMRLKPLVRWYTPLAVRCPALSEHLGLLIERCLDAGPENRPTAAEIHAALRDTNPHLSSTASAVTVPEASGAD